MLVPPFFWRGFFFDPFSIVDHASDSTIGRTLKKTVSSRIAASAGSSRRGPTALS
jgi:hypothetical protein